VLRDHVSRRTALGQAVQKYLDRGELVPDQVVLDMVREALVAAKADGGGYVLDGIPRDMQQGRAAYLIGRELEMAADVALHLQAGDAELIRRPVHSEVVPAAADRVTGHPEQREYHARYQDDDADRPEDGNPGDEPDNEENDSEDDQGVLLTAAAVLGRRQKISLRSNSSGRGACCAGEGCISPLLRLENRDNGRAAWLALDGVLCFVSFELDLADYLATSRSASSTSTTMMVSPWVTAGKAHDLAPLRLPPL
jgi:adenylate kinase family enzyme